MLRYPETRGDVTHDAATWRSIEDCWRAGDLTYLLDETQLEIYGFVRECCIKTIYVSAARQLGKSFVMVVLAIEDCINNPGKRVNYIAKTFGALKKMMEQTMEYVVCQAPSELRPVFIESKLRWVFPRNGPARGAFIQLVGADEPKGADTARGGSVVTNIIDEAAFIACLEYLLTSVLKPMGRRTGAKTILSSSQAESPDHYSCEVEDTALAAGALITRTYWAPGMLSREQKQQFLEEEALAANITVEQYMETTAFLREYMCQRVLEAKLAVVPEWPAVKAKVVEAGRVAVRPPWWDLYVSGDPGMDDFFGILFAVSDFRRSKLVIEHELLLQKANTQTVADEIGEVMRAHYACPPDDGRVVKMKQLRLVSKEDFAYVVKPFSAVFDDSGKRLCADMYTYHGLQFSPAQKDDREAAINVMRLELAGLHIEIHPRCVNLIRQLGSALRAKPGGEMARSRKDGHFDLISSLWYLVRSWNKRHNPYPPDWDFNPVTQARREVPRVQRSLASVLAGK